MTKYINKKAYEIAVEECIASVQTQLNWQESDIKFVKPNKNVGYGTILISASKFKKPFAWQELLLSNEYYNKRIKAAYDKWCIEFVRYPSSHVYNSINDYACNYLNSLRADLIRKHIIEKVAYGKYKFTANGKKIAKYIATHK